MSTRLEVFRDPDLITLLADEPELLALADAIAATQPVGRRRRAKPALLVAAAAVAALVAALGAVRIWDETRPSLVERALAAVGEGAVVHAVVREPTGRVYVDLASGERTPQEREIETWFDLGRKIERSVERIDGRVASEMLLTPEGGVTTHGPIYTCRWILQHPEAARKAGVSCDPKDADRYQGPVLDPALARFVEGYRRTLASGAARPIGSGELAGRNVIWLSVGDSPADRQEVAVDEESGRALRVRTFVKGELVRAYEVVALEALTAGDVDFEPPAPAEAQPVSGQVVEARAVDVGEAADVVPGALWAGPAIRGLELTSAERQVLTTGYGEDSGRAVERGIGVELRYGEERDRSFRHVRIQQSQTPQGAYAWHSYDGPPKGTVLLDGFGGLVLRGGVYVRIWAQDPEVVLEVARALKPIDR